LSSGAASVLTPAGPAAALAAEMYWVLIAGAALIFVATMGLLAAVTWRRRAPAAPLARDRSRLWLVGGGLVVPVAVLAALFVYQSVRGSVGVAADGRRGDLVVSVIGRMWWWEVRYRDPAGGPDIAAANEIHLPAGRAALLGLNSGDVIHSLVPSLAGKVDGAGSGSSNCVSMTRRASIAARVLRRPARG
jgi:cytochrome c oxidase subunit 2